MTEWTPTALVNEVDTAIGAVELLDYRLTPDEVRKLAWAAIEAYRKFEERQLKALGTQTLVCMRLADMEMVHPQQDNTHACARCRHQVGMYPSGQAALRKDPGMEIVCQVCGFKDKDEYDIIRPTAGSHDEMEAELRDSVPVRRQ